MDIKSEIIAAYRDGWESPDQILQRLNSSARIAERGRVVSRADLVKIIIDDWKIKPNSRFFLVDLDDNTLPAQSLYDSYEEAAEDANECATWAVQRIDL